MSRSYKKFPHVRAYCGKSGKYGRNMANRKIRRLPLTYDIPKGSAFKKIYNSYNIWDYAFTQFKEWEIRDWEHEQARIINNVHSWKINCHLTLEESLSNWVKFYKRK